MELDPFTLDSVCAAIDAHKYQQVFVRLRGALHLPIVEKNSSTVCWRWTLQLVV